MIFEILCRWILSHRSVFRHPSAQKLDRLPVDFVCFRGLLVALMSTVYDTGNDWEVWALRFRGTIYLCAKETQLKQVGINIQKLLPSTTCE
jgi:RAT1-interacting protein